MSFLEYHKPNEIKFVRIDADVAGALKTDGEAAEDSVLSDLFKNTLKNDKLTVKFENLKNSNVPAIIITDEYMRRYSEMGQIYGMSDGLIAQTMIVNLSNPIINKIKELNEEKQKFVINYVYSLALLSFKKLEADELDKFVNYNLLLLDDYIN